MVRSAHAEAIASRLGDEDRTVRLAASNVLVRMGNEGAHAAAHMLHDADPNARQVRGPLALPYLKQVAFAKCKRFSQAHA